MIRMPTLIVTRGLPGSGKTTWARTWVAGDRATRVRVNRDDLRSMIDDGEFVKDLTEPRIVQARNNLVLSFLVSGLDVVCDDTNLQGSDLGALYLIAGSVDAEIMVADLTSVPVEVCIERDAGRTGRGRVGEAVIRRMHDEHLAGLWIAPESGLYEYNSAAGIRRLTDDEVTSLGQRDSDQGGAVISFDTEPFNPAG